MADNNLKGLAKLFVDEAQEFIDEFKGNTKYEVKNVVHRMGIHLSKATTSGDFEKYSEDMKFEVSTLASVASIQASKAEMFLKETAQKAIAKGLTILFAAI